MKTFVKVLSGIVLFLAIIGFGSIRCASVEPAGEYLKSDRILGEFVFKQNCAED